MDEAKKIAEGFLRDTPDWVKLLGVLVIVLGVDRYGSLAQDVDTIKDDVATMKTTMLQQQTTLVNHEIRIKELEDYRRVSASTIESMVSMNATLRSRLHEMETP